jgi:hypothetical protein
MHATALVKSKTKATTPRRATEKCDITSSIRGVWVRFEGEPLSILLIFATFASYKANQAIANEHFGG